MLRKIILAAGLTLTVLVSSCGGGGNGLCGDNSQAFSLSYNNPTSLSWPVGKSLSYSPSVSPGSCRDAAHYAVYSGSLPPGLNLEGNGDIKGTPTVVGSYSFRIAITSVDHYQTIYGPYVAVSPTSTITVTP